MKANELMIGDWVLVHKLTCKGHRVDYINEMEEEIGADGEIYDVCDIKQIPLTPEILEKNGFESDTNMFGLCDYELSESYILENRGDRFCFVKRIPSYSSTFHMFDVKYAHQLQHALRLCQIEKEIEL